MPYAALSDLTARAGETEILQVADRDGDDVADAAVIAAAIATADQTIDAYLGTRYALPLTAVPAVVTKWAVSIARYHLHRDGAPEHVVRDHQMALAELRDAAAGRLSVPDATGLTPATSEMGDAITESAAAVFTDEAFEGWQ